MEEAEKRIITRNNSLRDIAFDLGFKNEQNFSAAFKKFYGYPPGHLRKRG
jgi:AraC-like DNA-binding protein